MSTLIEQLITKMGLRDEHLLLEKTTEILRLLELRSTNVPLQINEYGKIVICIDISATQMEISFDKDQALKLSGLRKSHYSNNKRMIEKLLDLNKLISVNEICIQLGINELAKTAEELLHIYKQIIANENLGVDIEHPQYASMAVFQAGKLLNKKLSKTKLMPFSNLRPTQWQQLEQRWEKLLGTKIRLQLKQQSKGSNKEATSEQICNVPKTYKTEVEDYEKWKNRMISTAEAKLQQLKTNST